MVVIVGGALQSIERRCAEELGFFVGQLPAGVVFGGARFGETRWATLIALEGDGMSLSENLVRERSFCARPRDTKTVSTIEQEREPLLTVVDVARLFGCSLVTVRRWERAGQLRSVRVGGLLRFKPEDVQRLIDERGAA